MLLMMKTWILKVTYSSIALFSDSAVSFFFSDSGSNCLFYLSSISYTNHMAHSLVPIVKAWLVQKQLGQIANYTVSSVWNKVANEYSTALSLTLQKTSPPQTLGEIIEHKLLKYRKVTRPGIESRTFWTYTRCSNQLSYLALEFNQLILYLCNCQPKDTYSTRHIQCYSLYARSTLWLWHNQISQSGNHVTNYIIQFQHKWGGVWFSCCLIGFMIWKTGKKRLI